MTGSLQRCVVSSYTATTDSWPDQCITQCIHGHERQPIRGGRGEGCQGEACQGEGKEEEEGRGTRAWAHIPWTPPARCLCPRKKVISFTATMAAGAFLGLHSSAGLLPDPNSPLGLMRPCNRELLPPFGAPKTKHCTNSTENKLEEALNDKKGPTKEWRLVL